MNLRWLLRLSLVVCSCLARESLAQATLNPGDTAVVATDAAQFGIRDQPMLTLSQGTFLRVTEVRGHWVGGYVELKGQKHLGWVRNSELRVAHANPGPVKPSAQAAADTSAAGANVPDDPQAVAALRTLDVTLNFDDEGRVRQCIAEGSKLREEDLVHLKGLPNLLTLDLSGMPITDRGIRHVAGCSALQNLYLTRTKITDEGLAPLRNLTRLEVLALANTEVTGAGLGHLADMRHLRVLNLRHCQIADDDLKHLERLNQLEVLALAETQISDAGLVHLRPVAKLIVLNLDHTRVTGTGFDNLLGLTELRMLYVRECQVEADRVDKLDGELPGLAIYD